MATDMELRERNKRHLSSLLRIKSAAIGQEVPGLREELTELVAIMDQEDVSWVEKIHDIKSL